MNTFSRGKLHNNFKKAVEENDVKGVQSILSQEQWLVNRLLQHHKKHCSFLHLASEKGFVEIGQLLIDAHANINQQQFDGKTPLTIAKVHEQTEMIELLQRHSAIEIDTRNRVQAEILYDAIQKKNVELVQSVLHQEPWLANYLVQRENHHYSFLYLACEHGLFDVALALLGANANVNQQCFNGYTPLFVASLHEHEDIVALLLTHPDIVVDLCDDQRRTALNCASRDGSTPIIQQLLNANARVDSVDELGCTGLMYAATHGHVDAVRLLLQHGANINYQCGARVHGLYWAAIRRDRVVWHLEDNATVHVVANKGDTPLTCALAKRHHATAKLLIDAGADLNAANLDGDTPLLLAVKTNDVPLTKHLLAHGGVDWCKKSQRSARQLARQGSKAMQSLFGCSVCGWRGMCCKDCREKYCQVECDKYSDPNNVHSAGRVDCRLHRHIARQSLVEWLVAMSSLQLPAYVLEHVFNSIDGAHQPRTGPYQERKAAKRIATAKVCASSTIDENYVHLIVEEQTHFENIQVFIAVHQAFRKSKFFQKWIEQ